MQYCVQSNPKMAARCTNMVSGFTRSEFLRVKRAFHSGKNQDSNENCVISIWHFSILYFSSDRLAIFLVAALGSQIMWKTLSLYVCYFSTPIQLLENAHMYIQNYCSLKNAVCALFWVAILIFYGVHHKNIKVVKKRTHHCELYFGVATLGWFFWETPC